MCHSYISTWIYDNLNLKSLELYELTDSLKLNYI